MGRIDLEALLALRRATGLVDGAVGYEPEPLDDPAPGQVLLCRARPRGPVTIDL